MKKNILWLVTLVLVLSVSFSSVVFADEKELIELEFVSWQWEEPGFGDYWNFVADEFTKANPNIRIKPTSIGTGADYQQYSITRFTAGDIPEINQVKGAYSRQYYALGLLEPLDGFPGFKELESKFLNSRSWNMHNIDGQQYLIPIGTYGKVLFYNKKMFDEAGVSYPETWDSLDDFVIAAKKLTKVKETGEKQYGYSFPDKGIRNYLYGVMNLIACQGGNIVTKGEPTATSPEVIKAISILKDLLVSGATPLGIDLTQAWQIFWEEKAAMLYEGPWIYTNIKEYNPDMIPYLGFAGLPGNHQVVGIGNGFGIIKNQEHKDEAWKFIMFLNSERMVKAYAEMTGLLFPQNIPVTEKALESFPVLQISQKNMVNGVFTEPEGMEAHIGQIVNIVYPIMEEVFYTEMTPEAGAEKLQKELEKVKAEILLK